MASVLRCSVRVVPGAVRILDPRLVVEPLPGRVVLPVPLVPGRLAGPHVACHDPLQCQPPEWELPVAHRGVAGDPERLRNVPELQCRFA
eukprot:16436314-Heterocapsa_arctica.AAC.1